MKLSTKRLLFYVTFMTASLILSVAAFFYEDNGANTVTILCAIAACAAFFVPVYFEVKEWLAFKKKSKMLIKETLDNIHNLAVIEKYNGIISAVGGYYAILTNKKKDAGKISFFVKGAYTASVEKWDGNEYTVIHTEKFSDYKDAYRFAVEKLSEFFDEADGRPEADFEKTDDILSLAVEHINRMLEKDGFTEMFAEEKLSEFFGDLPVPEDMRVFVLWHPEDHEKSIGLFCGGQDEVTLGFFETHSHYEVENIKHTASVLFSHIKSILTDRIIVYN